MSASAPGTTKVLVPSPSPSPSSLLFTDEPLFFSASDEEPQPPPSIEREEAEVENLSERPQTPTRWVVPAGLLEWTGPAGLIEWREEQVKAAEGDDDLVVLEFVLTPRAAGANEESAEVLVVDGASEGLEAAGDSDVVEVIWAVEGLEVTEAVEAVAAERQVQPKVCGNRN